MDPELPDDWELPAPRSVVMRELLEASKRDCHFSEGRVLSSMCTEPLDIAREAHCMFMESNLGNAGLYPGTLALERWVVDAMGRMLGLPGAAGGIVSGGTEANITALWIARNINHRSKVLFPRSGHFSFHKACDILGLEPVMVDLDDSFRMDIDMVSRLVDENTCAVVGIAGTTELGAVDDIPALADLLPEGTFLHVDAAFGGFVLPFLKELGFPVPEFDFSLPGVCTMTADPHKMGMATVPSGALLARDREWFRSIHKDAPYLDMLGQLSALSGTRASGSVAATYAAMRTLGREGYRDIVKRCMDNTMHGLSRARKLGLEPVMRPVMNILGLYVPDPDMVRREMDARGWKVSVARNPECLRLVFMPHVSRDSVDRFFDDLEDVL